MKIKEIRVFITPWIHDTDNYEIRVRIYPETGDHCNIQTIYPVNHLKSFFDVIWEEIFYRFNKMVSIGIRPYPMVYNNENKDLKRFQRWVVRRYYEFIPWEEYKA